MTFMTLPIVVDAAAKAAVILAVTAVVAAALRRASASARHFVWTLGLLSALAVPVLSVALPRWELPIVRVSAAAPVPSLVEEPSAMSAAGAIDTAAPRIPRPDGHRVAPVSDGALSDAAAPVRKQAAWALGAIGDGRAVTPLTRSLKDPDAGVRRQAAWALGAIGG